MSDVEAPPADDAVARAAADGAAATAAVDAGPVAMVVTRLRKYGWALLTPVGSLLIAALTNAVASRSLGPEQFGAFTIAVTAATLLGIAMGFGMPATMVRYAGRFAIDARRERAASVQTAWQVAGITTAIGVALGVVTVFLRPPGLATWMPGATGLWIVAAGVGVVLTEMTAASDQLGLRFASYFRTVLLSSSLRLGGIVVAILLAGPRLVSAVGGFACGYVLAGFINATISFRGRARIPGTAPSAEAQAMLRFGAPVVLSAFIVAAISAIDTLTVATTLGAAKTGWYGAAVRLTVIQQMLIQGITTLALPLAIEAARRGDAGAYARRVLLLGSVTGALVTAVLVVLTPIAVQIVYGERYEASIPLYRMYAVGMAINFPGNPLSQLLYARNQSMKLSVVHVVQLCALLLALPVAAARWDALGVAACWAAVNWGSMLVIIFMSVRESSRTPAA